MAVAPLLPRFYGNGEPLQSVCGLCTEERSNTEGLTSQPSPDTSRPALFDLQHLGFNSGVGRVREKKEEKKRRGGVGGAGGRGSTFMLRLTR